MSKKYAKNKLMAKDNLDKYRKKMNKGVYEHKKQKQFVRMENKEYRNGSSRRNQPQWVVPISVKNVGKAVRAKGTAAEIPKKNMAKMNHIIHTTTKRYND